MPMFAVKRLFQRHAEASAAPQPHRSCSELDTLFASLLLDMPAHASPLSPANDPSPASHLSPASHELPEALQQHCRNLLLDKVARIHVAPYFPAVLLHLLRLLRDPAPDAAMVAELVAADASLTTQVLRLANCPQLRCTSQTIDSLHKAAGLLGFEGMYALVAAAAMEPVLMRPSRAFPKLAPRLWRHALSTAQLLQSTGDTDAAGRGHAYLAGLLGGIGNSIVCHELQRHSQRLLGRMATPEEFALALQDYATPLTAAVVDDWRLPQALCDYVEPDAAPAAVARLTRASHAVKAGMLVQHQRAPVIFLEATCQGGPAELPRRVLTLLNRE